MSRPRFLADHDLNEHIVDGVLRREPAIDSRRVREFGLSDRPDPEILSFAAVNGFIVVSHDVNTMPNHAYARIAAGETIGGVLMVQQGQPIGPIIDNLVL